MSVKMIRAQNAADECDSSRRRFVRLGLGIVAAQAVTGGLLAARAQTAAAAPTVSIENFSPAGLSIGVVVVPKILKSDAQWRSQLSPLAYNVTRHEGTERPFSGEYAEYHADGIYHCVCCDTPLYDSRTKFESGTGWPSFWQAISAKNIVQSSDTSLGMHARRHFVPPLRCALGSRIR